MWFFIAYCMLGSCTLLYLRTAINFFYLLIHSLIQLSNIHWLSALCQVHSSRHCRKLKNGMLKCNTIGIEIGSPSIFKNIVFNSIGQSHLGDQLSPSGDEKINGPVQMFFVHWGVYGHKFSCDWLLVQWSFSSGLKNEFQPYVLRVSWRHHNGKGGGI